MKPDELTYPCLCVHRKLIFTVENQWDLVGATADGHRTGVLQDLKIIDASGRELLVQPPPKKQPIAVFFGVLWARLTRRKPRPKPLELNPTGKTWTVYQIRQLLVIDSQRQGPVNRVRSKELTEKIDAAKTPAEILRLIASQSSNTSIREW
ncbi:MAG TPA: hypothetical protein VFS24_06855 [Steroidobacteraceae bacterium]|nr:hypothetical protein [Steroidobacteraceae bacterium]